MAAREKKSKKPSATKAELLLSASTFFVDRSLGKGVGLGLRHAGWQIELHCDHFQDDTPDRVWLSDIGARGWIALTKDKGIRRNPLERNAVIAANVRMFFSPERQSDWPTDACNLFAKPREDGPTHTKERPTVHRERDTQWHLFNPAASSVGPLPADSTTRLSVDVDRLAIGFGDLPSPSASGNVS
jgi:hypothetical protein